MINKRYRSTPSKMAFFLKSIGTPQDSYRIRKDENRPPKRSLTGFSLIEVITVLFIISIMALGSVTVFRNFREKTSVRVAARDVTNIMRLARRRAVIEREDYLAVYDLGNEKVWVQSESSYSSYGIRPDSGTEQLLPDMAIIARVTAGSGGLATGTGDPAIEIDDYSSNPIGYHKFSPKSTVDDYTESPYSIEPSVWLKDERRVNFYKVTLTPQTARAKIYSEW